MHELGDYDNVLGYLEQRGADSARPRSSECKGSYADLQRLRNESRERLGLNGVTTLSVAESELVGAERVDGEADGIQLRRRTDRKEGLDDS